MSFNKTAQDINRDTNGVKGLLNPEMAAEVWAKAADGSAVMSLARQITVPASGLAIPIITGEPAADWVGETAEKPVSNSTFSSKVLRPYKMAVIEVFSNEFQRDLPALYDELVRRLPLALARKFDATVLGGDTKPGSDFDQLHEVSAIDIQKDAWAGLVSARSAVAANGGVLNGWALSPQAEGILLTQTDKNGRPLFVDAQTGDAGVARLVGASAVTSRGAYKAAAASGADVVGFGGDWTNAVWGAPTDISLRISNEATLNDGKGGTINLFQRNMFAVLCEFEIGFRVDNDKKFVRLTNTKAEM